MNYNIIYLYFKKNIVYILLIIFLLFLLFYQVRFFKNSSSIAGWDTVAHEYNLQKYSTQLYKGNFFYWDNYWFNGYPALLFYPPLFFIIVTILYYLTFKLLSIIFLLKIVLLLSTFAFVYAIYFFIKYFFHFSRKQNILSATLISFLWLFAPSLMDQFGIGINSIFSLGEITNFVGIIIGLFLIGYFKYFLNLKHKKFKNYIILIFIYSALLLTHVFSFFFFSMFFFFVFLNHVINHIINHNKKIIKMSILPVIYVIFGTILVSSFWLIPFLSNLGYSSAAASVNFFKSFPFLKYLSFIFLFGSFLRYFYIVLFFVGFIFLTIKKYFDFIITFILTILLAYGFTFGLHLTIHYYRFVSYAYLLYVIFVVLGFNYLDIIFKKYKSNILNSIYYIAIILFIFVSIYFVVSHQNGFYTFYKPTIQDYHLDKSDFPLFIQNLDNLNKKLPIKNIYIEQKREDYLNCIVSPHFLESYVAQNKIPSIIGLYTESSTTTRYLFNLIYSISKNARWLTPYNYKAREVDVYSIFNRLRILNINYVLAYSDKLKYYMNNYKFANLLAVYNFHCKNNFNLYYITNQNNGLDLNEIYIEKYYPLIYFGQNSVANINFTKNWFDNPKLYNIPLVTSQLSSFDFNQLKYFSAVIIPNNMKLDNSILNLLHDKNIIFIKYNSEKTDFNLSYNGEIVTTYVNKFLIPVNSDAFINNININSNYITFDLNSNKIVPVIIQKSYFPYWTTNTKIYYTNPNEMLIFTKNKKIALNFKIPLIFNILFLFFILFFIFSMYFIFKHFKFSNI